MHLYWSAGRLLPLNSVYVFSPRIPDLLMERRSFWRWLHTHRSSAQQPLVRRSGKKQQHQENEMKTTAQKRSIIIGPTAAAAVEWMTRGREVRARPSAKKQEEEGGEMKAKWRQSNNHQWNSQQLWIDHLMSM